MVFMAVDFGMVCVPLTIVVFSCAPFVFMSNKFRVNVRCKVMSIGQAVDTQCTAHSEVL